MVWVIEDGNYSDYHIVGIFSSRKKAALVQVRTGGTIREVIVDPAVDELNEGLSTWHVLMLRGGDTEEVTAHWDKQMLVNHHFLWERTKAPYWVDNKIPISDCLDASVWAKDQKHAIKIVNEIRVRMIANGEWKP